MSIRGIQLGNCHLAKYLGIIINENLNWKPHVQYLQKKLSTATGIIAKMRYYLKEKNVVALCYVFFHTYLLYGILGWEVQLKPSYTLSNTSKQSYENY